MAGNKISVDKYNEMAEAYEDVQTLRHVTRAAGVDMETAKRYVEDGDPDRGLPAIAERYRQTKQRALVLADKRKAEVMAKTIVDAEALKAKVYDRLTGRLEDDETYVQVSDFVMLCKLQREFFGKDDPISGQKLEALTGALILSVSSSLLKHGITNEKVTAIMDTLVGDFRDRIAGL